MNLYFVRNVCVSYYDSPFVLEDSPARAFQKAKELDNFQGNINDLAFEDEVIEITEFILETQEIRHYIWDSDTGNWEVKETSIVHI